MHLRLKSIYKAFKSSTTAASTAATSCSFSASNHRSGTNGADGTHNNYGPYITGSGKQSSKKFGSSRTPNPTSGHSTSSRFRHSDDPLSHPPSVEDLTPGALMLAAAASAAAPSSQLAAAAAAAAASVVPNAELAAAAHAAAGLVAHGTSFVGRCSVPNVPPTMAPPPSTTIHEARFNARASAESYEAERVKAEKAAAELLAELDEEEQAEKTKKSKKKKKKERQQAKREEQKKVNNPELDENSNMATQDGKSHAPSIRNDSPSGGEKKDVNKHHSLNHVENNTATTTASSSTNPTVREEPTTGQEDSTQREVETDVDPLEKQCRVLEEKGDIQGLEELLSSMKGVPGKAVLRKNAKKALKRLRAVNEETVGDEAIVAKVPHSIDKAMTEVTDSHQWTAIPETPSARPPDLVSHNATTSRSHQLHPGTVTPPLSQTPRVSDLLQIVSHSHNKVNSISRNPKGNPGTPKSECIMHMSPLIVGKVIGKGGQRIRDLMEESGARIWIDQDSMAPQDPRIVYVSGQRGNVDSAVQMITDIVSKAPSDTPTSKQASAPGAPAASPHDTDMVPLTSPASVSKIPGMPVNIGANGGSAFQLKPREKKSGDGKSYREMSCDPRFVPLLIGRRGWTIKNIQDSSGARVDIDQNVTPRRITISGSDEAVDIAARMVGDVLSYPHSLLHSGVDDIDLFGPGEAMIGETENTAKDVAGIVRRRSEGVDQTSVERPSSPCDIQKTRSHSSPPSSLIMAGDGKSTISATSSLSSTPEPSISNNKQNLGNIASLLPPAGFDANVLQPSFPSFSPSIPQGQSNSHHVDASQNNALRMEHSTPNVASPLNSRFIPPNSHGIAPLSHGGAMPPPPPPLSQMPPNSFEHQPTPLPFATASNAPHNLMPLPTQHGFSSNMPPVATTESHRSLVHAPLPAGHHHHQRETLGVWGSEPPVSSSGDTFGLAAAVDFLQYNQEGKNALRSESLPQSSMNEIIGLSSIPQASGPTVLGNLDLDRRTSAPPFLASSTGGKDESNIVDSLFGSTSDPRNDASLVSGLRGLSLEQPLGHAADPWAGSGFDLPPVGASTSEVPSLDEHLLNPGVGPSLFSTTTAPDDRQHSRFSWGVSD